MRTCWTGSILSPYVGTRADHECIRGIPRFDQSALPEFQLLGIARFEAEIAGKSPAFSDMLRKRVTDPVRCAELRVHTAWSSQILDDSEAYTLTKTPSWQIGSTRELLKRTPKSNKRVTERCRRSPRSAVLTCARVKCWKITRETWSVGEVK